MAAPARCLCAAALALALGTARAERAADPKHDFDATDDAAVAGVAGVAEDLLGELDANRDGKLDRAEILRVAAAESVEEWLSKSFTRTDADGDGGLDALETEEFIGKVLGKDLFKYVLVGEERPADEEEKAAHDVAADAVADLFRELDADQDGLITLQDLVSAVQALSEPDSESEVSGRKPAELVQELFGLADSGRDGSLDRIEAQRFLELLEDATGVSLLGREAASVVETDGEAADAEAPTAEDEDAADAEDAGADEEMEDDAEDAEADEEAAESRQDAQDEALEAADEAGEEDPEQEEEEEAEQEDEDDDGEAEGVGVEEAEGDELDEPALDAIDEEEEEEAGGGEAEDDEEQRMQVVDVNADGSVFAR